jgi:heme oxygenase
MSVIHGTLDHELRYIQPTPVTTIYQARPSRLAHLRADLSAFDRSPVPDCLEAVRQSLNIAENIRRIRLEQPENLLAFMYVLEGTTLGNAVHYPDVVKTFGDRVAGATHYYEGYGEKTEEYWQEFRCAMNALPIDDSGREKLIRTAHMLFDMLEPLFLSFYPIKDDGWGFTASMLNPEAGNHPVPGSESEIQAAVTAARRCREEFPYFDERYGERGKSFAKSDAAWIVTLILLPQGQFLSQLEWLGRVLGNRGMPRITLERQLDLLYEELLLAYPNQKNNFVGLHEAAEYLKSERLRYIPEATFQELARQFHIATDGEQQGKLKRTGALIVSAVCDETVGITEAVSSLVTWLTDQERFSTQWIEEVNKTVELARKEGIHSFK